MSTPTTRAFIYLLVAQAAFISVGYIIHASLGRILEPALYGVFGLVIYTMTLINNTINVGIPSASSKFIAERGSRVTAIIRTSFYTQVAISLIFAAIIALLAPLISELLSDPSLTPYIYMVAAISPVWGLYLLTFNYLNGLHRFTAQALIMVAYSSCKILLVFGLVFTGLSVLGAIAGYMLAPVFALAIAIYYLKPGRFKKEKKSSYIFPTRKLIAFATPIIGFSTALILITNLDLLSLKPSSEITLLSDTTPQQPHWQEYPS